MSERNFMTLRSLLGKHRIRQSEFAALVKADANTVNNWATGRTPVPRLVWFFFDILEVRPELKDIAMKLLCGEVTKP